MNQLQVQSNSILVGDLSYDQGNDRLKMNYAESWRATGFQLSPHLPLEGALKGGTVKKFIENLFPEGNNFEDLLNQYQIGRNHTFRILQIMGRDTTGSLKFVDPLQPFEPTSFRKLEEKELEERLNERTTTGLIVWDGKPRLSVAGVQDKLPLVINSKKEMGFGDGDLVSTHILKFQKRDDKIPHLVLNEYFCMKLAKAVNLDVAEVEHQKVGLHPVLKVKRFDRELLTDMTTRRFHVIDGCQALDLSYSYKYERNFGSGRDVANIRDGANLKKLFDVCQKCSVPAVAITKLLAWLAFNLFVSNADSHGKNISYFIDKKGMSIAPFYDLVNIAVYPKIEQELAMSIGNEFSANNIGGFQLLEFCNEVGVNKKILHKIFKTVGEAILKTLKTDQIKLHSLDRDETEFLSKLKENILKRTQHLLWCSDEMIKIK